MQKKIPYPNEKRLGAGILRIEWGKLHRLFDVGPKKDFYGYETIGPRIYVLHRKNDQLVRTRAQEVMRLVHDTDCPKCKFPETISVRKMENVRVKKDGISFDPGDLIRRECSSGKCDWTSKI